MDGKYICDEHSIAKTNGSAHPRWSMPDRAKRRERPFHLPFFTAFQAVVPREWMSWCATAVLLYHIIAATAVAPLHRCRGDVGAASCKTPFLPGSQKKNKATSKMWNDTEKYATKACK